MENFGILQTYRGVGALIVNALKKEIKELGETEEKEPVLSHLLQRKKELEEILEKIIEDLEK